jgi:hypothetical protein
MAAGPETGLQNSHFGMSSCLIRRTKGISHHPADLTDREAATPWGYGRQSGFGTAESGVVLALAAIQTAKALGRSKVEIIDSLGQLCDLCRIEELGMQ